MIVLLLYLIIISDIESFYFIIILRFVMEYSFIRIYTKNFF